ncbi:MAG TPA: GGDEF domain-containing protein [Tepidisphaeraceae bacterium]|jgi:diguanylate cyclase (GGDEF)-like protein
MEDSAPLPETPPLQTSRPRGWRTKLAVAACVAVAIFGLVEYLAAAFLARTVYTFTLPLSVTALLVLTACLVVGGALFHFVHEWRRPVHRLRGLLEAALAGELTSHELDQPLGGLSPLVPVLQDLFREMRRQRIEVTKLNLEIRHRVAQRTDALERMVARFQAQATRDGLTGLYNRRMLDQSLEPIVQRCVADKASLCVVAFDVDDFKLLNDTLGHAAGDSLLKAIGQLVRSTIRHEDLAFRTGGDEFVIVLPRSTRAEGQGLAGRLSSLVDALVKPLELARKPRLSTGLCTLGDLTVKPSAVILLESADKDLYATKFARKNRKPDATPTRAA